MSANNLIYIDRTTNCVWYQGCADNDDLGEFIGQGINLDEAVTIANNYSEDLGEVEYGIKFIDRKEPITNLIKDEDC